MFGYGIKSFARNIVMNVFIILQLAAVMLTTAAMISNIESRYDVYRPFENLLEGGGELVYIPTGRITDPAQLDETMAGLTGVEGAAFTYTLQLKDTSAAIVQEGYSYSGEPKVYAYDDELLELYLPTLESGSGAECISGMSRLGERLRLTTYDTEGEPFSFDVTVDGVLADKSKLLASDKFNALTEGCRDLFTTYYRTLDSGQGKNTLILRANELRKAGVPLTPTGLGIIRYSEGISQEAVVENERALNSLGGHISFKNVKENTLDNIHSQLLVIVPIIGMLLLTVLLCIVSTGAIKARRQIHSYAIFALCGARRGRLFLVGLTETAVCVAAALLLSEILYLIAPHLSLTSELILKTDLWVILAVILIAVLTLAASAIIGLAMTLRLPIKAQLYRER
ncbi:MAG: hypothetical protein IJ555_13895 [Ruminococcus sp.]|nr:hypothetical protein [Ruminococcus sp.]